jgi:hypothetical protein
VNDAPLLKVAACGEFWFVRSTVVPETVTLVVVVKGTTGEVLPGFPVHAAARTHAMMNIRNTGKQILFMHGRKDMDLLIIVVHFIIWKKDGITAG